MKLKVLFFPGALIVSVILFIWFIGPEFFTIKDKINELDSEEKTLREIMNKKQNLNNLEASLNSNAGKESLVLDYLSFAKKEEEIVNALDYLATSSGISLLNLTVTRAKAANPTENSEETSNNKASAKKVEAELELVGSYEGIKSFLSQIYRAEKANDIRFVNISRQPESDSLLAEVNVNFSYLPRVYLSGLDNNLDNPIFSQREFKFAIVDSLADLISGKVPEIEVGSVGKANPFLP